MSASVEELEQYVIGLGGQLTHTAGWTGSIYSVEAGTCNLKSPEGRRYKSLESVVEAMGLTVDSFLPVRRVSPRRGTANSIAQSAVSTASTLSLPPLVPQAMQHSCETEMAVDLADEEWERLLSDMAKDPSSQRPLQLLGGGAGDIAVRRLALNDNPDGTHSQVFTRVLGMSMWRELLGGLMRVRKVQKANAEWFPDAPVSREAHQSDTAARVTAILGVTASLDQPIALRLVVTSSEVLIHEVHDELPLPAPSAGGDAREKALINTWLALVQSNANLKQCRQEVAQLAQVMGVMRMRSQHRILSLQRLHEVLQLFQGLSQRSIVGLHRLEFGLHFVRDMLEAADDTLQVLLCHTACCLARGVGRPESHQSQEKHGDRALAGPGIRKRRPTCTLLHNDERR